MMPIGLRLDRVIGRRVRALNNRPVGRLEECRIERRGAEWVIREWVIGSEGLLERLGLATPMVLGVGRRTGLVASWDQLDLTDPQRPRLRVAVGELRRMP
jgi:hypothetical protein